MIDYLTATKHLQPKDKPFLGHLQQDASYQTGWDKYLLKGCRNIDIWHNKPANLIRIKGSLAYFIKGNNFSFSKMEFVKATNYINDLLHLNFFDSDIDAFEYGVIIPVENCPRHYIENHREGAKSGLTQLDNPKDKGNYRRWESPEIRLKMYDAGKNIKNKQGFEMQQTIQDAGWNPDSYFLKWEGHYKKPHLLLNKGIGIQMADLVHPNFDRIFRNDLYNQYKRLMPMGKIEMPTNKKDLSTSDLLMLALADTNLTEGNTLGEVKKMLFSRVNTISDEVLTEADKKARKRQISALLKKIQLNKESQWDLTEKLKVALDLEDS